MEVSIPAELRAVPADCLQSVCDALALLQECGLTDVGNVQELHSKISNSMLQVEGFTTENAAMSEWAQTPESWLAAERPDAGSCCKLEGLPPNEIASKRSAAIEEHQAAVVAAQGNNAAAGGNEENLDFHPRWLKAQAAAEAELQMLADESVLPQSLGCGSNAIFAQVSQQAVAPPPMKPKRLQVGAAKGNSATAPALPRRFAVTPSAVTLHIGSDGCGMGVSLWQRLFREHRIEPDGRQEKKAFGDASFHFQETAKGRFLPRAVFVDADSSGLEVARASGMFAPDDFALGKGVVSDSWTDAYDSGRSVVEEAMESLRSQQESSDRVSAIMTTHSMYDPVGGAFASRFVDIPKSKSTLLWNIALSPPLKPVATWPGSHFCNTLLSMQYLLEKSDFVMFVDHAALEQAAVDGLGIKDPTNSDYNDLVSRVLSGCTSPSRMASSISASEGSQPVSMQDIVTSMTPYPRIHFVVPSVAPLRKEPKKISPDDMDATGDIAWQGITSGKLSSMDPADGKMISMALLCRGILHGTARERFAEWRTKRSCVYSDWSPTGLVLGTHRDPVVAGGCEAVGLHNHTGIRSLLQSWASSYDESSAAGGETDGEARENIQALIKDYEEVAANSKEDSEEGEEE